MQVPQHLLTRKRVHIKKVEMIHNLLLKAFVNFSSLQILILENGAGFQQ